MTPREPSTVASVALATAALVLAEVRLGALGNYVMSDELLLLLPVLVFGGLSLGSLVGVHPRVTALGQSKLLVVVELACLATLLGLARAPVLGLAWAALPMIAFGAYLTCAVMEVPLRSLVWALGIGGGVLYLVYGPLLALVGAHMGVVLVALVAAAVVALRPARATAACAAGVLALTAGAAMSGALEPRSFLEQRLPGLQGATRIAPSIHGALIRTDVLRTREGDILMTTNGSRYAIVPPAAAVEEALAGRSVIGLSYDAPHFVVQPRDVLVIGSAEGWNVVAALRHGAERIVAVDINPAVFQLMKGPMAEYSGGFYDDPRVEAVTSEGRRFAELSERRFDLVTLQGVQTGSTPDLRSTALVESFLFTEEGMRAFWRVVDDDGLLYYDEYERFRDPSARDETLVGTLAKMAAPVLGLTDVARQCFHFTYAQAMWMPGRTPRPREGLLVSRAPLDDARIAELRRQLEGRGGRLVDGTCAQPLRGRPIRDDRPFFLQMVLHRYLARVPSWALVCAGALVLVACGVRARRPDARPSLAMGLTGVGFVLFLLGVTSPAGLLLGEPALATPVVFVSVYASGLVGGLLALRADERAMRIAIVAMAACVGALAFVVPLAHGWLSGVASLPARVAAVALLLTPAGLLAEIPYVFLLGRAQGRARGWAYVAENVGSLAGIPVAFALMLASGTSSCLLAAAVAYVLALVVRLLPAE